MSAWTEDRIARLKTFWPAGRSATWIAAELGGGLTRNAVLAKVWRLGLSEGRGSVGSGVRRERRLPAAAGVPVSPPPDRGAASILSVRRFDCRWPYGDPLQPGFSLCGCRVHRGAYCAAHADLAYRGVPQSVEGLMRWAGVA